MYIRQPVLYLKQKMTSKKRQFGDLGEKLAAKYLKNIGYDIIAVNFQNKYGRQLGEIDIIARDKKKNELIFVEVKTRGLAKYQDTLPEENITYSKLKKMERTAGVYLRQNRLDRENYRFDAISVWIDRAEKKAKIKHIPSL